MDKKKAVVIALCVVILAACIGGAIYVGNQRNAKQETTTVSTTETTTESTTVTTTESTTVTTTETTQTTTKKAEDKNAFLYSGYWYIFDDDKVCAYALSFNKKGGVILSYFNTDNVTGGDPMFLENEMASYKIKDNVITVTKLPSQTGEKELKIDIREDDTLYYLGVQAVHKDDLNLDYPFKYFNA